MANEPSWKNDSTEPGDLARRDKDGSGTEPEAPRKAGWKQEAEPPAKKAAWKQEPEKPAVKATAKWKQDGGAQDKPAAATAKWRQEDVPVPTAASTGWSKRHKFALLATGVFATLIGLIVVVLWLIPPKPACVFLIGAGYEDNLAIPHNVYGRESLREFADVCRGASAQSPWLTTSSLKLRQEPVELLKDQPWDRGLDSFSEPTVVLYIAMHGGSDGQGPFFLVHDADLSENEQEKQKLRLRQVISRLGQLPPEKNKVLIIDATQVPSHWGLGMMHNDFARGLAALKESIEAIPNLVVLSASDADQRSWVSDEWRKSIFAHFILEGLKGAADRDGSSRVTALELHQYVAENVEKWVRANRGTELQTPVLLGGEQRAAGIELVVVHERYQPPDAGAVPVFSPPRELQEAWTACQQLEKSQPSPAAYTPTLWRRYQETLLRYDALVRAGDQRKTTDLRRELIRLEEDIGRAQRLELASAQNAVNMPQAVGFASSWSDRELQTLFNDLWKTPPAEQEKKWKLMQAQAADKASRQVLQQKLAGLLLDRAAENPGENLAPATALLHILCGKGNFRPTEAHYLAMLRRDFPEGRQPGTEAQLALRLRRQAENVALGMGSETGHPYSEQVYLWTRDKVQEADARRRAGEDRLFATDASSLDLARKDLQEAQKLYAAAQADADAIRTALLVRNEVLANLPYYARWVASRRQADDNQVRAMELLCQEAHYLARLLETPNPERISKPVPLDVQDLRPQTIPAQTETVKKSFQALKDDFTQHCRELRNVNLPSVWRDTEAALAVPDASDPNLRFDLMTSARSISRTFHLQSTDGRTSEAAGISKDRNSEQARTTAQRQGRMALAVIDRRWFNDPLFAGADSGYLQVQNRLQSFGTEERWWVSLGLAGDQIGERLRKMPTIINQKTVESRKLALKPAGDSLLQLEQLARQVDGSLTPLLTASAGEENRRVALSGFLLWQADRTLHDHWFAEEPGNEPYYRYAGNLYVDDARTLVEGNRNELTPPERKVRLEAATRMQERVQQPGLLTAVGPGRLDVTSEPELPLEFRLQADPKGWLPPGFPVLWLETGKFLAQPGAAGRLIREVGGTAPPTPLAFKLTPQAEGPAPRVPRADASTATLRGVYRGQLIEQVIPIGLHRLPQTVVYNWPLPPGGGLAVTADAAIHNLFGPSNGAIAIVLDCTGTMGVDHSLPYDRFTKCKYHDATTALRKVLERLPRGATLSVFVFGQDGIKEGTITTIRPPARWDPDQLAKLMDILEPLRPTWHTPLVRSMVTAKEEGFPRDFKGFKTMLVLTDGMDNMFLKDPPLLKRHNTTEIPKFLELEFKDAGMVINVVGFKFAPKEEKEAIAQFKIVEKLPLPGKIFTVDDTEKLVEALDRGLRQRLRFLIEQEVGGLLKDMPEGGWDVSRTSDNNRWVQLEPGAYKVRVLTNRVIEQRVQIGRGDFLLLGITPDGNNFERVLYGDDFRFRPHKEEAGWLLTNFQNQIRTDRSLEMMLAVENRSTRMAVGGTLQQVRPREVWLEVKPAGTEAPVAFRWGALAGYPAPTFDLQALAWPNRTGAAEPARSTVTAYYNVEETTPIAASVRRPANLDFTAAFTNQEAQTGLDAGDKSVIESVTIEDQEIETGPGKKEKLPCLVVRLRHPPGKPVWVQPEGLERQGDAPGHEHRFYTQANKYTGVFYPVTRDAALNQLRALHLIALDRFKQQRTTAKIDLNLEDLPDSRTRPKSVPELIEAK